MIKVLIVDDDPMVRQINEKFLKKIPGYSLYKGIGSVEEAKKILKKTEIDLVFLDIFLLKDKGTDLLKWIRNEDLKCDVIFITADTNKETVEEAFRYGAIDYLIKPFTFKRFEKAMIQYRNRKNVFVSDEEIEQSTIDECIISERNFIDSDEYSGNIKGVSQNTYEKILDEIKKMGRESFTANELAEKIGVSRITARRYLDYLEKEQKLIVEHEYGKVGRPKNKYKIPK